MPHRVTFGRPGMGPGPAGQAAAGLAARVRVSRASHADWEPVAGRTDPIAILEVQAADRTAELVPIRYGRMLSSPFAFYRGAAAIIAMPGISGILSIV